MTPTVYRSLADSGKTILSKNGFAGVSDTLKAAQKRALGRATAPVVDRAIRHIL